MVYNIIEIANTHSGNFDYAKELVNSFTEYSEGFGIKFQPFYPDSLATKDYEWYEVYKRLYFNSSQWEYLINKSTQTKDVWLDIFDSYGVQILKNNFDSIYGIKFQASVLYNYPLIDELKNLDAGLSEKKLILNIASYNLQEIEAVLERINRDLSPEEILLEIGFQSYPTSLHDSGLVKLKLIKDNFDHRIVFADHLDGKTDDSLWLPIIAMIEGADVIEKHVMLSNRETEYDHFSSITPEKYKIFINNQIRYQLLNSQPFITSKEREYLKNSLMIPLAKRDISSGSLLNLKEDLIYKRSGAIGLNAQQIRDIQTDFHILNRDKNKDEVFVNSDFQKATIATIIACRLKSTRLPRKALRHIGKLTSLEFCIKNCLQLRNVNHTIVATSYLDEDSELKNYLYSPKVIFHQGHPDDVIERYLDIVRTLKIDVIIRVTADMPFVDDKICKILLASHFENGSDYTTAKKASIGSNLEIINSAALEQLKTYFPQANYSEYMSFYFQNNPEYFRLNFVDLPNDLVRNYRLTLDYEEDLVMFNEIDKALIGSGKPDYSLSDVIEFLDNNQEIGHINAHKTLKYKEDKQLVQTLTRETRIMNKSDSQ